MSKTGDKIAVGKFHVSKLNVRANEAFGKSEDDKVLMHQLYRGKIIGPFKARKEGKGFGVYVGRRRFLAKKAGGTKHFVVGSDVIIADIDDENAREESLLENLTILRKAMNPMQRARHLSVIVARSPGGIRGTARRLGINSTTLDEWLRIMHLAPSMQKAVAQGKLYYTDALHLARAELGSELQDELAEVLDKDGMEGFRKELARVQTGKGKRGIPKDVYLILRTTFDRRSPVDVKSFEKLGRLAKAKDMEINEYGKMVLVEHAKKA